MPKTSWLVSLGRGGAPLFWLVWLAGCSLVTDLNRFRQEIAMDGGGAGDAGLSDGGGMEDALGCSNPRTLCVRLEQWPHKDQLAVVDLVTDDNNLRARAVLSPFGVGADTADIVLPLAIPESEVPKPGKDGPLHLEIWADKSADGEYTPDADHDWKVDLPASGNLVFVHNSEFKDLVPRPREIGGDFLMHFTNMQIHAGKMLEVMVIEDESGRTVGFERFQRIPDSGSFDVKIPGIIDTGNITYRVEFYADAKMNRTYDGLPSDHAWVKFAESGDQGVEFPFAHNTDFMELDYQFDFHE